MISFETIQRVDYHAAPEVATAIENLNRTGYAGIVGLSRDVRLDDSSVPLVVVNPVSRGIDEPLSAFDGFVLRTYGASNGQRSKNNRVLNALVAEVTGMPVIGIPLPDRDWHAPMLPKVTGGIRWHKMSDAQKSKRAIEQVDVYASSVLESVEKLTEGEKAPGTAYMTGESGGAAVSLGLAHVAKSRYDVESVAICALPNVEKRKLYRELFFRDFARSDQGMHGQVHDGPVPLAPLSFAGGFTEGPKKKRQDISLNLGFMFQDIFGLWPFDRSFELYKTNIALGRTLTMPVGLSMIERVVHARAPSRVAAGFFEHDTVARYTKLKELGANVTTPPRTQFALFEGVSHTACNNPYILGYMATLLLSQAGDTSQVQP